METLTRLLDSDPAVRWQVLTDLTAPWPSWPLNEPGRRPPAGAPTSWTSSPSRPWPSLAAGA